jgi:anti-anti-sigma factor
MQYEIRTDAENKIEVFLRGQLTTVDARIWDECALAADMARRAGVTIDLTGLTHIDSGGLGFMLKPLMDAKAAGVTPVLRGPTPPVMRMLKITMLAERFDVISPAPQPLDFKVTAQAVPQPLD